jgi:hypothetical protein
MAWCWIWISRKKINYIIKYIFNLTIHDINIYYEYKFYVGQGYYATRDNRLVFKFRVKGTADNPSNPTNPSNMENAYEVNFRHRSGP